MRDGMILLAQAWALAWCIVSTSLRAVAYLPIALITIAIRQLIGNHAADGKAVFYEGIVMHSRKAPAENSFRCVNGLTAPGLAGGRVG